MTFSSAVYLLSYSVGFICNVCFHCQNSCYMGQSSAQTPYEVISFGNAEREREREGERKTIDITLSGKEMRQRQKYTEHFRCSVWDRLWTFTTTLCFSSATQSTGEGVRTASGKVRSLEALHITFQFSLVEEHHTQFLCECLHRFGLAQLSLAFLSCTSGPVEKF